MYLTLTVSGTPDTLVHSSVLTPFPGFIVHVPKLYILLLSFKLLRFLELMPFSSFTLEGWLHIGSKVARTRHRFQDAATPRRHFPPGSARHRREGRDMGCCRVCYWSSATKWLNSSSCASILWQRAPKPGSNALSLLMLNKGFVPIWLQMPTPAISRWLGQSFLLQLSGQFSSFALRFESRLVWTTSKKLFETPLNFGGPEKTNQPTR